jgi:hypothetical protein
MPSCAPTSYLHLFLIRWRCNPPGETASAHNVGDRQPEVWPGLPVARSQTSHFYFGDPRHRRLRNSNKPGNGNEMLFYRHLKGEYLLARPVQ